MTLSAVKPIVVKPARVVTPQCCVEIPANTHHERWRQERYAKMRPHWKPTHCQHESTVEIDGLHYCTAHAGKIALDRWLSGKLREA
jgi:hypothetical protein